MLRENVLCGIFDVAEIDCLNAHCKGGQEGEKGDGGEVHFEWRLLVVFCGNVIEMMMMCLLFEWSIEDDLRTGYL